MGEELGAETGVAQEVTAYLVVEDGMILWYSRRQLLILPSDSAVILLDFAEKLLLLFNPRCCSGVITGTLVRQLYTLLSFIIDKMES